MGTDSLKLFNKRLADSILSMGADKLESFLKDNLDAIRRVEYPHSSLARKIQETGEITHRHIEKLGAGRGMAAELENLVLDCCMSADEVYLDYWGSEFPAFGTSEPEGSIPVSKLLPHEEEPWFMLLFPRHVDKIIGSLNEHADDLQIMGAEEIKKVAYFRDYCLKNPDFMVAYIFDF